MSEMTAEEFLAHYGTKGMKWGVRKAKPTSDEIKDARIRVSSQQRQIQRQIDVTNTATGKTQAREAKKLGQMGMDYLNNPDRATAIRMTTGEKVAAAIVAVGLPGAGTAGVAAGVGVRTAVRRNIEKKQATGYYNQKLGR